MKLTKESMKKLAEVELLLRKGCHAADCSHSPFGCPRTHLFCDKLLDGYTAIAWNVARTITTCIDKKSIIKKDFKIELQTSRRILSLMCTLEGLKLQAVLTDLEYLNLDYCIRELNQWIGIRRDKNEAQNENAD